MELVGVRNISLEYNGSCCTVHSNLHSFSVDTNIIYKITSISVGKTSDGYPVELEVGASLGSSDNLLVNLNGGSLFATRGMTPAPSFPFYLEEGLHQITINRRHVTLSDFHIILYGLEFKLTTP